MQIASMKIFCDVARHRSFSQAAAINQVTQSAVSQIVSQLEKGLQVQLVDRSTRPLQLTAPGQSYYEGCQALVELYEELAERNEALEAGIRNAQVEVTGKVQVAAIYSVGLGDMGQHVHCFQNAYPRAQVHIDYLHPDRVYEWVLDGTADLGLVSFPKKMPQLVAVGWREEDMVLACAPRHQLASRPALAMRELQGKAYVHFDRNLVVRRRVDRFLREQGVSVEVVAEFDSIENIKQAVAIDAGVALLPGPTLRQEVKAGTLAAVPLHGCRLTRPLAIIHRRGHRLSAAAKRFRDLLLQSDAEGSASRMDVGSANGGGLNGSAFHGTPRGRNGKPRAPTQRT